MPGQWPNLLVIGAHKAGSTSLHEYLGAHPEIEMSAHKELSYFAGPVDPRTLVSRWSLGQDWYKSNFTGPARIKGESSTAYTNFPFTRGVPQRIATSLPSVRLIYIVRDPVARLISHVRHVKGIGRERRPLAQVLEDPQLAQSAYLLRSRYALQLKQYLAYFSETDIHIVDSADLRRHRQETLRSLFSFLAVDPEFHSPAWEKVHNESQRFPLLELVGRVLPEPTLYQLSERRRGFRRILHSIRRSQGASPNIPEHLLDSTRELLVDDASEFRALTDRTFDSWTV